MSIRHLHFDLPLYRRAHPWSVDPGPSHHGFGKHHPPTNIIPDNERASTYSGTFVHASTHGVILPSGVASWRIASDERLALRLASTLEAAIAGKRRKLEGVGNVKA